MTDCQGAYGRDIVARGCALAEQRLAHLTELFETGRWRRFHTEQAFLENIREAAQVVEVWRGMATQGDSATKTNAPEPSVAAPALNGMPSEAHTVQPKSVHIDVETSVPVTLATISSGPPPLDHVALAQASETPEHGPLVPAVKGKRRPVLRPAF